MDGADGHPIMLGLDLVIAADTMRPVALTRFLRIPILIREIDIRDPGLLLFTEREVYVQFTRNCPRNLNFERVRGVELTIIKKRTNCPSIVT